MTGFKILTKQGLKGPFRKSSLLKAITSAMIPLQARLLDLETGRYLSAAELVGETVDPPTTAQGKAQARNDQQDLTDIKDFVVNEEPPRDGPDDLSLA
jgi:hypothetical protein